MCHYFKPYNKGYEYSLISHCGRKLLQRYIPSNKYLSCISFISKITPKLKADILYGITLMFIQFNQTYKYENNKININHFMEAKKNKEK